MRLIPQNASLRWMLLASIILFAVKALFLIATPLRALVMSPWLIDDSFIVARVARNIALGHGFSFDALHPTTGVSMLWTYLTALNHVLFAKETAVRATLLLSTFFGTLCSAVIYVLAHNTTGSRGVSWLAFILTSLSPVLFFNAMNGMETAFFSLCTILALAGAAGAWTFSARAGWQGVWTGFFCGLALLTRADAVFIIAAIALLKGWDWLQKPTMRKAIMQEALGILGMVLVCFALFSIWQLQQTGSLFPDNQIGRRAIALQKHHFDYASFSLLTYGRIVVWNVFEAETLWTLATGSSLLALFALFYAYATERLHRLSVVTGVYVVLFVLALVSYQWYFPDFHGLRYFNGGAHLCLLFIAALCALLPMQFPKNAVVGALCVVLLTLSWYRYFDYARSFPAFKSMSLFGQRSLSLQDAFWGAMEKVSTSLPADAVIGLRDHGRMAFFTDRPIQDLAGIIDPAVLIHKRDGTLGDYLRERSVAYVFLPQSTPGATTIYQAVHDTLPLEKVENFPPQEITGYSLYRVLPMPK